MLLNQDFACDVVCLRIGRVLFERSLNHVRREIDSKLLQIIGRGSNQGGEIPGIDVEGNRILRSLPRRTFPYRGNSPPSAHEGEWNLALLLLRAPGN